MVMVAFLLAAALQQPADFSKGSHLYGACQAAVRMSDDPNSQQARTEMPSSTYCFGYLAGYVDGLNVLMEKACVLGAFVSTVARVYISFMQRNPKLMDEAKHLGVGMALRRPIPAPSDPLPDTDRTLEKIAALGGASPRHLNRCRVSQGDGEGKGGGSDLQGSS